MAMKTRTLNELRQEKNYGYKAPLTHNQKSAKIREGEIDLGYTEIDIDTTKELIINKLGKQYYDIIFQAVCDEMNKHEVFQEETYFTPQGMDWFEDAWFEFFHEHHGDIIHAVINNGIVHDISKVNTITN
jgi:hypothetical protein